MFPVKGYDPICWYLAGSGLLFIVQCLFTRRHGRGLEDSDMNFMTQKVWVQFDVMIWCYVGLISWDHPGLICLDCPVTMLCESSDVGWSQSGLVCLLSWWSWFPTDMSGLLVSLPILSRLLSVRILTTNVPSLHSTFLLYMIACPAGIRNLIPVANNHWLPPVHWSGPSWRI